MESGDARVILLFPIIYYYLCRNSRYKMFMNTFPDYPSAYKVKLIGCTNKKKKTKIIENRIIRDTCIRNYTYGKKNFFLLKTFFKI